MSEKNSGRPLPLLQGQAIWSFAQINHLELSTYLLFDQMYKNYTSHKEGQDEEGDSFQVALIQKIREKEQLLQNLNEKLTDNKTEETKNKDSSTEEEIIDQLNQIQALLKKHTVAASEEACKLKSQVQIYLMSIEKDIEYHTIQQKLKEDDAEKESRANASCSDLDQKITPRPRIKFSYRRSARLQETIEATKSVKSQIQITKRQEKELDKLNKECEELQSHLEKAQEEANSLRQSLQIAEDQIGILKQENDELRKILEEVQIAHASAQQSFEEVNKELAQYRNVESEIQIQTEAHIYNDEENNNEKLFQLSSSDNTDEEVEKEHSHITELPKQDVKDIMTQINNINQQGMVEKETKDQYLHGYKLLKNDFLRFGRKSWNTKTVEAYLKLLVRKKKMVSESNIHEECSEQGLELISQLFRLSQGLRVLGRILESFHEKIKTEIETLKSKKSQFLPIETINTEFENMIKTEYADISGMTQELTDKLKDYITINPNKLMKQLNDQIKQSITILTNNPFREKTHPSKITEAKLEHQSDATDQLKPNKQNLRKLVIIPKDSSQMTEISKQIREEIMKPEIRSKIRTVKKTLNNNIELHTLDTELNTLKQILEEGKIQEHAKIIETTQKQMKILLLRVPNDVMDTELQLELERNQFFKNSKPEIIKSFPVKEHFNNWVISSTASSCRPLLQRGKIKIFTDQIRVVRHITVLRCSNCQALEDHITADCKYTSECATCAQEHSTINCTNTEENCINCIRRGLNDTSHKASSTGCPIFRDQKSSKLNSYYGYRPIPQNTSSNLVMENKQNKIEDSQKGATYSSKYPQKPQFSNERRYTRNDIQEEGTDNEEERYDKRRREYRNSNYVNNERNSRKEHEILSRHGETRTISIRTIENSNRKNNNYSRQAREAKPPYRR